MINMAQSSRLSSGGGRGRRRHEPVRVLVDMDGVLADFEGHLLQVYREKFPDEPFIPLEDRTTFYACDQYVTSFGDHMQEKVMGIINGPGFYRDIPPIEGAIDAVKEISSMDGVEVSLCTSHQSTSNFSATDKLDWVTEHLGQAWTAKVIMSHDKTLIHGDLLIDDKHRIGGSVHPPSWKQVLFTQCHNCHIKVDGQRIMARLASWSDKQMWQGLITDCIKSRA